MRDDFTMNGTPKVCVANDLRPRMKLSLWPFCKWILASKAILATFEFLRCQRAPYFASRSGWLDTYKKNYKIGMGRTPFRIYAQITQNSYRTQTRKQWIRQTCSYEKILTRPAEGRTGISANFGVGLGVFWNCELFVLKRFFY